MRRPSEWAGASGQAWAASWPFLDRALNGIEALLGPRILEAAPEGPFDALDIGTGPGTTALALAAKRPDARVLACDISEALAEIARERARKTDNIRVVVGDAVEIAERQGPFDLLFSRHGVMFFADPYEAFGRLRGSASPGARLIFSCFAEWEGNLWASDLAAAVGGEALPAPGPEPGPFAFADPARVEDILVQAGWGEVRGSRHELPYLAGEGVEALAEAEALLTRFGPASRILGSLADDRQDAARKRLRDGLARFHQDGRVTFPAAAWIWSAQAN